MLRKKPGLKEKLYGHDSQLTNEDLVEEIKKIEKADKVEKKPRKKK